MDPTSLVLVALVVPELLLVTGSEVGDETLARFVKHLLDLISGALTKHCRFRSASSPTPIMRFSNGDPRQSSLSDRCGHFPTAECLLEMLDESKGHIFAPWTRGNLNAERQSFG